MTQRKRRERWEITKKTRGTRRSQAKDDDGDGYDGDGYDDGGDGDGS